MSGVETKVQEEVKNVSKKLSEVETKVQEDVKNVSKQLSEHSMKLNEIRTKIDMHIKYFPLQIAGYVSGALVCETTLLTAVGWDLH